MQELLSEPVRHTPTSGLFPSHSQTVAEILAAVMLSTDIPSVVQCPLSQKGFLLSTEAKVLLLTLKGLRTRRAAHSTAGLHSTQHCQEQRGRTAAPPEMRVIRRNKKQAPQHREEFCTT